MGGGRRRMCDSDEDEEVVVVAGIGREKEKKRVKEMEMSLRFWKKKMLLIWFSYTTPHKQLR